MLSSEGGRGAEPAQGSCAGYPASADRGDDGSEWAGCLAPVTHPVPGVCPQPQQSPLDQPVLLLNPLQSTFSQHSSNSGPLKWEAAPHPCPPRSLQRPPSVSSDILFP